MSASLDSILSPLRASSSSCDLESVACVKPPGKNFLDSCNQFIDYLLAWIVRVKSRCKRTRLSSVSVYVCCSENVFLKEIPVNFSRSACVVTCSKSLTRISAHRQVFVMMSQTFRWFFSVMSCSPSLIPPCRIFRSQEHFTSREKIKTTTLFL